MEHIPGSLLHTAFPSHEVETMNVCDQPHSSFLQLPAEIRNMIYNYAFREQNILAQREARGKLILRVEPEGFPVQPRYPLFELLARTAICRQVYAEAALLPMRLSTFKIYDVKALEKFTLRTSPAQLAAVTSLRLSLRRRGTFGTDLGKSGLGRFTGVVRIIVEIKRWPLSQTTEEMKSPCRFVLFSLLGRKIEVEFE